MLFQTVYGVELEAIYQFIITTVKHKSPVSVRLVYQMFIEQNPDGTTVGTQSIDDALRVLYAAFLIEISDDQMVSCSPTDPPFCSQMLSAIRALEIGTLPARQPIDQLYGLLLTELFIKPNTLFIMDVHTAANQLAVVQAHGGLSREKIQAWKRVMEFLGVGRRAFNGFQCVYHPKLIQVILERWDHPHDTLYQFLTSHLARYIPFATYSGELANAALIPLLHLQNQGILTLSSLQDSPSPAYGGSAQYRAIQKATNSYD